MLASIAVLACAQFPTQDLKSLTTLRTGELVRCYKRGGRTRNGMFQELIVVTPNNVFVKSHLGSTSAPQDSYSRQTWKHALSKADPAILTQRRRDTPMFPSAYDAVDIFLTYRYQGKVVKWTNEAYVEPEPGFYLLDLIQAHPLPAKE